MLDTSHPWGEPGNRFTRRLGLVFAGLLLVTIGFLAYELMARPPAYAPPEHRSPSVGQHPTSQPPSPSGSQALPSTGPAQGSGTLPGGGGSGQSAARGYPPGEPPGDVEDDSGSGGTAAATPAPGGPLSALPLPSSAVPKLPLPTATPGLP